MLEFELETALTLADHASQKILELYRTDLVAEEKLGVDNMYEPVTIADRIASRMIVDGLRAAFPDDAILSEEDIDDKAGWVTNERAWIIDPIDGTAGYINQDGDFAVQIGLAVGGKAMLGVVQLPFYGITHYAVAGSGAFIVNDGETTRLHTSSLNEFAEMKVAMTRNHYSRRMAQVLDHFGFKEMVRRGSVGLKIGLIAIRECDVYIHLSPRTKLWDSCAPEVIITEAGGRLTDVFGEPLDYHRSELSNLNGLVATNGAAHAAVIDHLRPLLDEYGRTRQ